MVWIMLYLGFEMSTRVDELIICIMSWYIVDVSSEYRAQICFCFSITGSLRSNQ